MVVTGKGAPRIYVSPRDSLLYVPRPMFLNSWHTAPYETANCPRYCCSRSLWNEQANQTYFMFNHNFAKRERLKKQVVSRRKNSNCDIKFFRHNIEYYWIFDRTEYQSWTMMWQLLRFNLWVIPTSLNSEKHSRSDIGGWDKPQSRHSEPSQRQLIQSPRLRSDKCHACITQTGMRDRYREQFVISW